MKINTIISEVSASSQHMKKKACSRYFPSGWEKVTVFSKLPSIFNSDFYKTGAPFFVHLKCLPHYKLGLDIMKVECIRWKQNFNAEAKHFWEALYVWRKFL